MTPTSAISTDNREFVPDYPKFRLDPPSTNLFVAAAPISVTQYSDRFDFEWSEDNPHEAGTTSAERIFEDILFRSRRDTEEYPTSVRARTNLGFALLNRGQLDEAAREFELALKLRPNYYVAAINLARIRALQGEFEEADRLYESLHRDVPTNPTPLMSLAYLAMRREDFGNAERLLKRVIDIDKNAALPRYHLAVVLLRLSRPTEAIGLLKLAARSDIRSPALYHALGVAYAMKGDLPRAVRCFKTALTLAPELREAVHALANILLQQREVERSIHVLTKYLESKPDDFEAREILARAYADQKQYNAARLQWMKVSESIRDQDWQSLLEKARLANDIGVCLDFEGDWDQAKRWFTQAMELCPDADSIPYNNIARVYIRQGHFRQAWEVLTNCRTRFAEDRETWLLLALSLEKQARYDEAIQELEGLVQTGKAMPEAYADLGWLLADHKRNVDSALTVLREAYERFPAHEGIVNNLAYALLLRGESTAARRVLESLPKEKWSKETQPALTATWGLLRLWEGHIKEGEQHYREAERLASLQGTKELVRRVRQKMRLELARAYVRVGDFQAASNQVRLGLAVEQGFEAYTRDLEALRKDLLNMAEQTDP